MPGPPPLFAALLLWLLAVGAVDAPAAPVPEPAPEPVHATAPALPLNGRQSRPVSVASEARDEFAGDTAREMLKLVSTTALKQQEIEVAGLPAHRYRALLPASDGGTAREIAIIFVFAPKATHILWAERGRGEAAGQPAALDQLLLDSRPG